MTSVKAVAQLIASIIRYSLDHHFHRNALFWAERLVALSPTNPAYLYYHGLALFRAGKTGNAYAVLAARFCTEHARAQYLLARCCFDLGCFQEGIEAAQRAIKHNPEPNDAEADDDNDDNDESEDGGAEMAFTDPAEDDGLSERDDASKPGAPQQQRRLAELAQWVYAAIDKTQEVWQITAGDDLFSRRVDPAAAYALLGLLQKESGCGRADSVENLLSSARANPFLFMSVEALLQQGYDGKLDELLPQIPAGLMEIRQFAVPSSEPLTASATPLAKEKPLAGAAAAASAAATATARKRVPLGESRRAQLIDNAALRSPQSGAQPRSLRSARPGSSGAADFAGTGGDASAVMLQSKPLEDANDHQQPMEETPSLLAAKRGIRPEALARKRQKSDNGAGTGEEGGGKTESRAKLVTPLSKSREGAFAWALSLLRTVTGGLQHSLQFRAGQASYQFMRLPPPQYETAWVHTTLGVAYAECQQWALALRHFQQSRRLDKLRQESMDVFSTALWQTGSKVQLSHLAHELVEANRRSPQAWVVMGNAFSLQREHETALKCFQRAIQLDPTYAYAYSLAGHEHLANDDYEKSLTTFRNAIKWNPRLYNAWYGLALVYSYQENLDMAEYHYTQALKINQNSSTLFQNLAGICFRLRKFQKALDMYDHAIKYSEEPTHALYRKARVLMEINRITEAKFHLEEVRNRASNDPKVYESLGEVYEKLGRRHEAIDAYMVAMEKMQREKPKLMDKIRRLQLATDGNLAASLHSLPEQDDVSMWRDD